MKLNLFSPCKRLTDLKASEIRPKRDRLVPLILLGAKLTPAMIAAVFYITRTQELPGFSGVRKDFLRDLSLKSFQL